MARRFKLLIEYDGRPFAGWQIQANAPSIQAALTKAIHAFTGAPMPGFMPMGRWPMWISKRPSARSAFWAPSIII
jgi:tRNA U38,U39,U40 pseudouridine synthase TruA